MSSGSKNVIALVLINNICYSKKQKQIKERKKKIIKKNKIVCMKPWLKNWNYKSA